MAEPMLVEIVDGIHEYLHANDDGTYALQRVQDVQPVIDANKARQNDGTNGWSPTREWRHVAEIPMGVALQWLTEDGIDVWNRDHMSAVIRKLNDPDWRYLRTGTGIIKGA